VEILEELRALQRDLTDLGDAVAVALLDRAERCFVAWEMATGEHFLEQALSRVQESLHEPPVSGVGRYFATCAMAVA
jgi:hypothetical protein